MQILAKIKMIQKNKKGFTLVELIVVIVILGILLAILIPSISKWMDKAKVSQTLVDARSAYTAAQTVAIERYAAGQSLEGDNNLPGKPVLFCWRNKINESGNDGWAWGWNQGDTIAMWDQIATLFDGTEKMVYKAEAYYNDYQLVKFVYYDKSTNKVATLEDSNWVVEEITGTIDWDKRERD